MTLISGGGPSLANLSCALSLCVSILKELVVYHRDEELVLEASRFAWFHNKHMNRWHGRGKDDCFNCGDMNHFITNFPKMKGKPEVGKHDYHSSWHNGKYEYTSSEHKAKSRGGSRIFL
jgi:hypothetical protein